MNVGSQEKSIAWTIFAASGPGLDVRGVQDRQGSLSGDGAPAPKAIHNCYPERALSEPRHHDSAWATTLSFLEALLHRRQVPWLNRVPWQPLFDRTIEPRTVAFFS